MNFSTPASQMPPQRWVTLRTGGSFHPACVVRQKRDRVERKVKRGCLQDLSLLHDQPQTGRKRVEETGSVGRYRVCLSVLVCRRTGEQDCGTNRASFSSQINLGQAKGCWRNSSKADPIFNLKIAQRLGGQRTFSGEFLMPRCGATLMKIPSPLG